jgi:hypothetical protein
MKVAVKIREETYPLMLLANAKGYPDSSTFSLTSYGFPEIDATVTTEADRFELQITTADPIWSRSDGAHSNGGYDERLVREELNKNGIAHCQSAIRRENGAIVSAKPIVSIAEVFEAYVRGMEAALRNKINSGSSEVRLLVHVRGFWHATDLSYARVLENAFDLIEAAKLQVEFGGYYFLDEASRFFLEHVP